MFKRYIVWVAFVALAVIFSIGCGGEDVPVRPNILLIISDDQRYEMMPYMPRTTAEIFAAGVAFERAYITLSRCCPSRSTILTGMYAHNHNVIINSDPLEAKTMVQYLDETGYFTGLVGKYLNSYPVTPQDPPREEFDYWIGMISGPNEAKYYDTMLNVNGEWTEHSGYQTYILQDYALDFLQKAAEQPEPFFLIFSPYAPHLPALPAPGDEQLYLDEPPYEPPNYNPETMPGKPAWLQQLPVLITEQTDSVQNDRRKMLQTLNALDIVIENILNELEQQGVLDETLVIFLSDNGQFLGEHRLPLGKIYAYEESMHVPFAVRYPPLIRAPRVEEAVIGNIDIAPTIYELAGIPIPAEVDGRSLVPLLQNRPFTQWRDYLLLEGWPFQVAYIGESPPFLAAHSGETVYIETEGDIAEFYDLITDPYQLNNAVDDPQYARIIVEMQEFLAAEREGIPAISR